MLQPTFWQEESYAERVAARKRRQKLINAAEAAAILGACMLPLVVWILYGPIC